MSRERGWAERAAQRDDVALLQLRVFFLSTPPVIAVIIMMIDTTITDFAAGGWVDAKSVSHPRSLSTVKRSCCRPSLTLCSFLFPLVVAQLWFFSSSSSSRRNSSLLGLLLSVCAHVRAASSSRRWRKRVSTFRFLFSAASHRGVRSFRTAAHHTIR